MDTQGPRRASGLGAAEFCTGAATTHSPNSRRQAGRASRTLLEARQPSSGAICSVVSVAGSRRAAAARTAWARRRRRARARGRDGGAEPAAYASWKPGSSSSVPPIWSSSGSDGWKMPAARPLRRLRYGFGYSDGAATIRPRAHSRGAAARRRRARRARAARSAAQPARGVYRRAATAGARCGRRHGASGCRAASAASTAPCRSRCRGERRARILGCGQRSNSANAVAVRRLRLPRK